MASLISPGVSVTIDDSSFFIPAAAATVPLLFIATADNKKQATSGPTAHLDAAGTFEHNVVRTVTSLKQSVALYGIPRFLQDNSGNAYHGDCRNEYGLLALNKFLGVGNRAYVVRANVNLDDNPASLRAMWTERVEETSYILTNIANEFIIGFNQANSYAPAHPDYKRTITKSEAIALTQQAMESVYEVRTFNTMEDVFMTDRTFDPYDVFEDGYAAPATGQYKGFLAMLDEWESSQMGTEAGFEDQFTPEEIGDYLVEAAETVKYTLEFINMTSLGANDAARRVAVVTALQELINSNDDVRSEAYEYNLILCPGFPELADEMVALCYDIEEEAMVIADTPMDMDPSEVVAWSNTSSRQTNRNVAYYYPHDYTSNLDGHNVVGAASGIALRTMTYSDNVSELWFAPAGTRRGMVTGSTTVGYVSGVLGTPTTFVETALNQGQRDDLYKYFTNINPIVFFPGRGLIVWGQKTSAPDASALDRINVVRLLMYIKRQLRKNTMSFVFEPNDQLTRDNLKAMVDGFLGDLVVKRGLYDYVTIADESNNTPDRVDRNELYIDIALKPVKAAEFIYIPIRVLNTGADM